MGIEDIFDRVLGGGQKQVAAAQRKRDAYLEALRQSERRRPPIEQRIEELQNLVLRHLNLSPDDEHAKFMVKLIAVTSEKMAEMEERGRRTLDIPSPSG